MFKNFLLTSEENKNLYTLVFSTCDSKLNSSKLSNAVKVQSFQMPLYNWSGGGMLVYVKDQIMAKIRQDLESHYIACIWLEISPNKGKSFLLGSLYRSPTERVEWKGWIVLKKVFETVLNGEKEIILLGYFNKDLRNGNTCREWLILTESLGLNQLVSHSTNTSYQQYKLTH